jgi:hypothetical protein
MEIKKLMTKLTPAQAYAAQVRADRRAAALERRGSIIAADNARINQLMDTRGSVIDRAVANFKANAPKPRKTSPKVRWTGAELDFAINLYLQHYSKGAGTVDSTLVMNLFAERFPKRGNIGVNMLLCQIKGLDTWCPAKGLKDTSQMLIDKLYMVDPVRFSGGATTEDKMLAKIDQLLSDIRG